jgi:hypothetical protein
MGMGTGTGMATAIPIAMGRNGKPRLARLESACSR